MALLLFVWNVWRSLRGPRTAGDDPWEGTAPGMGDHLACDQASHALAGAGTAGWRVTGFTAEPPTMPAVRVVYTAGGCRGNLGRGGWAHERLQLFLPRGLQVVIKVRQCPPDDLPEASRAVTPSCIPRSCRQPVSPAPPALCGAVTARCSFLAKGSQCLFSEETRLCGFQPLLWSCQLGRRDRKDQAWMQRLAGPPARPPERIGAPLRGVSAPRPRPHSRPPSFAYVVVLVGILRPRSCKTSQGGQRPDYFRADKAWWFITVLTIGYMVAPGAGQVRQPRAVRRPPLTPTAPPDSRAQPHDRDGGQARRNGAPAATDMKEFQ
jgi:hypothetical protein